MYNNGQYNFSSDTDSLYGGGEQSAMQGYNNWINQVNNPDQALQSVDAIYRNAMVPAFEKTQRENDAKLTSMLGNRNFSTFGALTQGQNARDDAIARATLEAQIYNNTQNEYDNWIKRATSFAGLASGLQQNRLAPYATLGSLTAAGGQNVNGYNNALANIYGSQAGMYNANLAYLGNRPSLLGQLLPVAGQVGGAVAGSPAGSAAILKALGVG